MELRRSFCCIALALSFVLPTVAAAEPFPGLRKLEYKDYFPVTISYDPKITGSALTVMLTEGGEGGSWYLIKTPFGLVGWLKIEGYSQEADTIEGLYFRGD